MPVQEVDAVGSMSNTASHQLRYLELRFKEKSASEAGGAMAQSAVQAAAVLGPARPASPGGVQPVTGYDTGNHLRADLTRMLDVLQRPAGEEAQTASAGQTGQEGEQSSAASGLANSLTSLLHFVHSGDVENARKQAASLQNDLASMLESGEKDIKDSESQNGGSSDVSALKHQLQKDLAAMMNAVRVGDLNGARAALETYESHEKTLKQQGGGASSQFVSALQTLLQAVQTGDASSARAAAQALFVSDLQALLRAASPASGASNDETGETPGTPPAPGTKAADQA
jgi:hypothetical protein